MFPLTLLLDTLNLCANVRGNVCCLLQYRESLLEWRRRQLVERLAFLHKLSCFKGLRQQVR